MYVAHGIMAVSHENLAKHIDFHGDAVLVQLLGQSLNSMLIIIDYKGGISYNKIYNTVDLVRHINRDRTCSECRHR